MNQSRHTTLATSAGTAGQNPAIVKSGSTHATNHHAGIHHEQEQAERDDGDRKSQHHRDRPHDRIDDTEQRRASAASRGRDQKAPTHRDASQAAGRDQYTQDGGHFRLLVMFSNTQAARARSQPRATGMGSRPVVREPGPSRRDRALPSASSRKSSISVAPPGRKIGLSMWISRRRRWRRTRRVRIDRAPRSTLAKLPPAGLMLEPGAHQRASAFGSVSARHAAAVSALMSIRCA